MMFLKFFGAGTGSSAKEGRGLGAHRVLIHLAKEGRGLGAPVDVWKERRKGKAPVARLPVT
eukprot:2754226-Karenia_brevis.AAC.1